MVDACLEKNTRLVFIDNTRMYGAVKGKKTEKTPFFSSGNKRTDYIIDSSKLRRRFTDYKITTYQEGISEIIEEIKQFKKSIKWIH